MSIADVLSIQLYTMRSMGDLDRILDAVAKAGYRHVETVGSHLDDAATTEARLDAHGLKAPTSHVGIAALRERPRRWSRPAGRSAATSCSCRRCRPISATWTAAGWRALGRELGAMAERLRGQGIELGYHNHHWELRQGGCQDRARTAVRGRRGQPADLAGGRGLAGARRRRPEGVDRALSQPARRGPRQGHSAGRREPGPGRLGRCRLRRARLARPLAGLPQGGRPLDGGGARQAQRTRRPRPAPASPFSRAWAVRAMEPVAIGIIGCGSISDLYSRARRARS